MPYHINHILINIELKHLIIVPRTNFLYNIDYIIPGLTR